MKFALLFLLGLVSTLSAAPVINEFVADNTHGLKDQDGSYSDWIEIYNPDANPVDLTGWYLTDDPAVLNKWGFPSVTLGPREFLVVFASGKNRANAGLELHTNFSLEKNGESLILSQPGGAGITSQFNPYPKQESDFAYGISRNEGSADLVGSTIPSYLVPTNASQLPANWNQPTTTGGTWTLGTATGGVGYDTATLPSGTFNAARMAGASATQSSEYGGYPATLGIDGNTTNFTHTIGQASDPNPWWQVTFPTDAELVSLQLFNRVGCCPDRLRDITVQILDANDSVLWTSPVQNPNNSLGGPASLTLNLVGLNGSPITGRKVKVNRQGDGSIVTTNENDKYTLSMSEFVATANSGSGVSPDGNIAPNGTATQSSVLGGFVPGNAINNNFGDFTHTLGTDTSATWTLNLNASKKITAITLQNRLDCCGSRLRDITVTVRDSTNAVLYTSPLLNPENQGYAYPNGPANLTLDFPSLVGGPLIGQYIEIRRTSDPDLSGSFGAGNGDEASVLSLGEVVVTGNDFATYLQLVSNDVKAKMYNVNTSCFIRWPFSVAPNLAFTSLRLRVRHDDGYVAYLDGVKIAERSAPAVPSWNSAATDGERPDNLGVLFEDIDLASRIPLLTAGNHVLAVQGLTSVANDPDFIFQPQLFATWTNVNNVAGYLEFPTPGGQNLSPSYTGFVGDTNFSVKRGFYTTAQTVAITCNTPDSQIYYTTNGADPTGIVGTLYTGPIAISQTTVLRARALKPGWRSSNVDTNTYLFLNDVINQQPTGAPPPNWPTSPVGAQQMRYGMNPNVLALYGNAQLVDALKQIPSISIVTPQGNLTDPSTGIYVNASGHGEEWERPASIEWLDSSKPAGQQGEFQENCGIRIRGGASRSANYAKHSLRVYFRNSYGVSKLDYPVFGALGTREHDCIDLASSQNYSWPGENSPLETMLRDPFARMTLLATGSPACRNRYFHLYLNGLYWGLYYFDERPIAGYGEAYFGGKKDDYDALKTGNHPQGFVTEATDGYMDTIPGAGLAPWRDLWNRCRSFALQGFDQSGNPDLASYFEILGRNPDGTRNPTLPVLVDIDSLIDYMLVIFYSGDGDAPLSAFLSDNAANNWFALKNRNNPNMGFVFFNHDAEHTFGASSWRSDRTGPFNGSNQNNFTYSNPQWIFQDLCFSPEFRLHVADRAHKHFFNGGVMTTAVAQARMDAMAAQINLAVKAHAVRWGSTSLNLSTWTSAVAGFRSVLANRETTVINQLKAYNLTTSFPDATAPLYPSTVAPSFSQFGGNVNAGFQLTMTAPAGTIYYTNNGSDPRAVGGAVAGTQYTAALAITQPVTTVKARALAGGVWSALVETTFFSSTTLPVPGNLAITELHYHPTDPTFDEIAAGFTDSDDFEFMELMNIGGTNLNLTGCYFADGVEFTFPNMVLAAGSRLVLARNPAAFQSRYGFAPGGEYGGKLSNTGERIWLKTPAEVTLIDFTYDVKDGWPSAPDGTGPSLVLRNLTSPMADAASWRVGNAVTPLAGETGGTTYAAWKTTNGVVNDTSDADADGLTATLEYVTGSNPIVNSRANLPTVAGQADGSMLFTVKRANLSDDATLIIEYRDGLTGTPGWQTANATVISRSVTGAIETLVYRVPSDGQLHRFVRARFTLP